MSLVLREFREEDLEQVIRMYSICFDNHQNSFIHGLKTNGKNILDWKYQGSTRVVAEEDGIIIGHSGGLHSKMLVNGIENPITELVDTMVLPNARGRMIAGQLEECHERVLFQKGIAITYFFPNKLNEKRIRSKTAFVPIKKIPLLIKQDVQKREYKPLQRVRTFDFSLNRLFSRVKNTLGDTLVKSSNYQNWRITKNPISEYSIFVQSDPNDSSEIKGYVVLKSYQSPEGDVFGHVVDNLADSEDTLNNMVSFTESYFYQKGINQISLYAPVKDNSLFVFQKHGFVLGSTDKWIFGKILAPGCLGVDLKSLDLGMINHDIY